MNTLEKKAKQLEALGYQIAEYRPHEGAVYMTPQGMAVTILKDGTVVPGIKLKGGIG